jgi:hypothetical protein
VKIALVRLPFVGVLLLFSVLAVAAIGAVARTGEANTLEFGVPGGVFVRDVRTNCDAINNSDLHSPAEGVWAQAHCSSGTASQQINPSGCNRTDLEAPGFAHLDGDLYTYRRSAGSTVFLWYGSAADCFNPVSDRVATAVCRDQTVSFAWDMNAACGTHGGVLARVNG